MQRSKVKPLTEQSIRVIDIASPLHLIFINIAAFKIIFYWQEA
jgi:hypothetical protein